jgi:hypothetical protein
MADRHFTAFCKAFANAGFAALRLANCGAGREAHPAPMALAGIRQRRLFRLHLQGKCRLARISDAAFPDTREHPLAANAGNLQPNRRTHDWTTLSRVRQPLASRAVLRPSRHPFTLTC